MVRACLCVAVLLSCAFGVAAETEDIEIELKNIIFAEVPEGTKNTLSQTYAQLISDKAGLAYSNTSVKSLTDEAGRVTLEAGTTANDTMIKAKLELAANDTAAALHAILKAPTFKGELIGFTIDEVPDGSPGRIVDAPLVASKVQVGADHVDNTLYTAPPTAAPVAAVPAPAPILAVVTDAPSSSLPTWAIVLLVLGALALIAAVVAALCLGGDKKKKDKKKKDTKRALKQAPEPPQEIPVAPVGTIHEYAVTMGPTHVPMQAAPIYAAPVATVAQPIATYAAPVATYSQQYQVAPQYAAPVMTAQPHEFAMSLGPAHAPMHYAEQPQVMHQQMMAPQTVYQQAAPVYAQEPITQPALPQ